ncbi:putative sensor histidine kinase TcrY [mine drainage metagenome]|uniref:histidine kinase n=1 Tax=mine drainage metagenome TaxID=410659 RepID=A0A1J5RA07_9ZZZZ
MKLSFKKRIALFNTLAVAITTVIVFIIVYAVVYLSSYQHLDSDILLEKEEILNTLDWKGDSIIINKMPEWEEAEHRKVEVNPTFIQIVDNKDKIIFKSANLQSNHFLFNPSNEKGYFYNIQIDKQRLRLGQFPVRNDEEKIIGQLTIGVSQQESYYVLNNLLITLCISFPILLLILYLVIYFAASKSIAPVNQLIRTASGINDSNIDTRLPLPENEDELYQLASTINELLSRIDSSIQQQKQFTADASHEIRTPLAAIRGTLEVLLRKKREPEQYEEKIKEVITQTDRLNQLLDQLLQLARLESGSVKKETVYLNKILREAELKFDKQIQEKAMIVILSVAESVSVHADAFFLSVIIDNLFSNAIKYGATNGKIIFNWNNDTKTFSIKNDGIEITQQQMPYLFNRFYRTDDSRSSLLQGSGLGLAIVKKLADLQHMTISVSSIPGSTTFSIKFPV